MKYIDEFRNQRVSKELLQRIGEATNKEVNLMEVCGTHTVSIFRFGIRDMLPKNINLLSGPGCPVCVTSNTYIDQGIFLSKKPEVILATFGDMMKVPGSNSSLAEAKSLGADIRIIYSSLDALQLAKKNPNRQVVLMGIGFETTTPTIAAAILQAAQEKLNNFSVLSAIKVMPGALSTLMEDPQVKIDGFILPGHVSAIIGAEAYHFVAEKHHTPGVVTGFEPTDILQSVLMLVTQIANGEAKIENQYARGVKAEGNPVARQLTDRVFNLTDSSWRGIGVIPDTGLVIKEEFSDFDASRKFKIEVPPPKEPTGCRCGEVLRGIKVPTDCPLFAKACTPEYPVGACMVSVEGTCAAYYKYKHREAI